MDRRAALWVIGGVGVLFVVLAVAWSMSRSPGDGAEPSGAAGQAEPGGASTPHTGAGSSAGVGGAGAGGPIDDRSMGDRAPEALDERWLGEDGRPSGWVGPPAAAALDAAALPDTGVALSAPWMPGRAPDEPGWDPLIEAQQRFAGVEASLIADEGDDEAAQAATGRLHRQGIEALHARALAMREVGLVDEAQRLEGEWARIEARHADALAPLRRP